MSGRTPSFIVVGLVIIMFLLGLFYMSCSSKNTELRLSLEQFEERIRSLTIRHSDSEKKNENLNARKRELEEEKLNIQKQMEKKDSEINDLNTKLNEKLAELQGLNSDKKVADEQLKDYKSISETLASKNALIEQLRQQLNEQKQTNTDELNRIKQEYETYKTNRSQQTNQAVSNNEPSLTFAIPPQRFRPIFSNNFTTKSITSLFQDSGNRLNNLTKEIKPQIVAAALDIKDNVLNVLGANNNLSTTTITNQQEAVNNDIRQPQQQANQNVPAPPLASNAQRRQQPDHVESAQGAPQPAENNQGGVVDNLQRSSNNSIGGNKNNKLADIDENDDEEQQQLGLDNLQDNLNPAKQDNVDNNQPLNEIPQGRRGSRKDYRLSNRRQFRTNNNPNRRAQRVDNGEEVEDIDNNEEYRHIRKRRLA